MERMYLEEWAGEAKITNRQEDARYHERNKDNRSYQKYIDDPNNIIIKHYVWKNMNNKCHKLKHK